MTGTAASLPAAPPPSSPAALRPLPRFLTKEMAARVVFAAGILAIWQSIYALKIVPPHLFPSPIGVLQSLYAMAADGTLVNAVRKSMSLMLIGYAISVAGGLVLGVLSARSWIVRETFGSLALALQSLPSVCWLPLALIYVGVNEAAMLAVVILGALFSIAVSTEGAIRNIPPIYQKVGRVLGARGVSYSRDILLFAALPELISGLKIGWTFAWRSLMAAELIRQDFAGVGRILQTGRDFNDISMLFAGLLTILAIGLFVDRLVFRQLEVRVRRRYGLEAAEAVNR